MLLNNGHGSMKTESKLKALSLNVYIMGHVTYQNVLESTFKNYFPEIQFHSLHLTDFFKNNFWGAAMNRSLTWRLPDFNSKYFDYDLHALRSALSGSILANRYLYRESINYKPDILHIHTQSIALLSIPLLRKIPTIISIDLTSASVANEHWITSAYSYKPLIYLEKKCFQSAAHIITWCDWARNSVINHYDIPPEKVTTIYPGLFFEAFDEITPHRLAVSKPRILFVGGDFIRKGGSDLLEVFTKYFADTCELDIVTNANFDFPQLPNLRVHRGLRPLSNELLNLYRLADIFVMPTWMDTFPMVFMEAMAAGLPCIGTMVRGVPELVQDEHTGFVIPPKDQVALYKAIQRLVDDADLRLSFGLNGKSFVHSKCDAVSNTKQIAEIFTSCSNI